MTSQTAINTHGDLARAEGDVAKTEEAERAAQAAFKVAQESGFKQDDLERS